MKPLPKKYNHKEIEPKHQQAWSDADTYKWHDEGDRDNHFVIDTPPPTVSGMLHMGHIYSYTQADFVARYMRMKGKQVFYPMGFDDNGLPTERLVEKVKKIRAVDMSREDFITVCQEVAAEAREEFRRLFESIALSVDWKQVYSTISDHSRTISQMSFLDLYHKDQAYRKLQPMLWDPVDQTAIAQAEVEDKEMPSSMNDVRFTCLETGEDVVIATTRPELLGACVAVFYHPDDERYQHFEGKTAVTALFGVHVPLLADENVKMQKGTGLVMCCTFGDETDITWWREHRLPTRLLLDNYGKIRPQLHSDSIGFGANEESAIITQANCQDVEQAIDVFKAIEGQKVVNARAKMLELIEQAGCLLKSEKITHAVKCAERSGAALEIMPTNQWFVKVLEHRDALKAKAAECDWKPEFMRLRIDQWIDGLSWDWCISRQRSFGVPFPVWYSKRAGEEGKVLVASKEQLPVNPLVDLPEGYSADEVEPEADVMDTWATSSVSPQINSHAINNEYGLDHKRHTQLFPADLRPQAHEIIRTWAFYTIVKAYHHEQTIPWKHLMISGWCLASDKTKMSKSKGNVVTPVALIEEKGADVVRFWASTSRLGADTAYSEDVLKIGKKLVNKLFNASKFAALQLEKLDGNPSTADQDIEAGIIVNQLDKWIISWLKRTIEQATTSFEEFEYCQAREAIEDFFWNGFCDNYLEFVKVRSYGEDDSVTKEAQQSAIYTIYHCLDGILRLFAPFVPHVTEQLYGCIFEDKQQQFGGSVHLQGTWPNADDYTTNQLADQCGTVAVEILDAVRKIKAEHNVSIKTPIEILAVSSLENLGDAQDDIRNVTNSAQIIEGSIDSPDAVITSQSSDIEVMLTFSRQAEASTA